ncbi:MAG: GAF domain-containing protein, partial [Firmicutes bacterium]|nr:GAF domain-containing protein [Bacillota bacterium]
MDLNELQLTPEQKIFQLEKSVAQLSVLYSIAASITITTDADKVLELVLEKALDTLKAELGAIFFRNNQDLRLKVSRGGEGVFPSHIRLGIDNGIAAQVAQTGRALWIAQSGSHYTSLDTTVKKEYPVRSIICFPIKIDDKILGTIYIGRFSPEEFTEQEKWLLNVLANRASVAIESSRLYSELKTANEKLAGRVELANKELLQRMDELKSLYEVAQTMVASMNIDRILNIIIVKANQMACTNISTLRLLDEDSDELVIKASVGVKEEIIPLIPLKVGEGIVGEVAQTGMLQIAENLEKDKRFDYFPRELQRVSSEIVVPLKIGTRVIGVLVCASEEQMNFTSREVELLNSLAN